MSHFYAMGYESVMQMPIRAFWAFNRNVDRIQAQENLRTLRVSVAAQGGEALKEISEDLQKSVGAVLQPDIVVEMPTVQDKEDLKQLAALNFQ